MRKFIRHLLIEKELQVLIYFTLVGAMTRRIKINWLGNYHPGNSYLLHCKQTNLSFIQSNQSSIRFSKCFSQVLSFLSIDRLCTSLKWVASLHCNCSRLDFEDSKQMLELLICTFFSCITIPEHRVATVRLPTVKSIPPIFVSPNV